MNAVFKVMNDAAKIDSTFKTNDYQATKVAIMN